MKQDEKPNEWRDVPKQKVFEPDAISRTIAEMARLFRGMKGALYSQKTLRIMRNEFEEVMELIDLLSDDQRANANALLHSAIERGSLVEILRSILNTKPRMKPGKK